MSVYVVDELKKAGLSQDEIAQMRLVHVGNAELWDFEATFEKLFSYYMDLRLIPYKYAKGRDGTPDEWILQRWDEMAGFEKPINQITEENGVMKVNKHMLKRMIREYGTAAERTMMRGRYPSIKKSYNAMSDAGKSLAQRAKRIFAKDYPDVKVGINSREGWITVNGKKAVNMSSASRRPMSIDDIIDEMKQAYLGHPMQEGKTKITKRQLRRIIRESLPYRQGQPWTDPKVPVGVARTEDDLDRELTDEEIEAAMGMERADPSGDREFFLGYEDALDGKGLPADASPDYKAGWEDGTIDYPHLGRVTESIIQEGKMKITKKQLKGLIKEAVTLQQLLDREGRPHTEYRDDYDPPDDPNRPFGGGAYIDEETYSDVIVMSPNGDSVLVDGQETYIEDVPQQLKAVSGFPMKENDADNLIFALQEMWRDGYVELMVTYENGQWSW